MERSRVNTVYRVGVYFGVISATVIMCNRLGYAGLVITVNVVNSPDRKTIAYALKCDL